MELLAVISIIALLMGIGVGVFSKLNISKYAAVGIVRNALRSARESAMASGAPVTLVCDGDEQKMFDLSASPVAQFQFEDFYDGGTQTSQTVGAFDLRAQLNGAQVGAGGRNSGCLILNKPGSYASAELGGNAEYVFSGGLAAEVDVYIQRTGNYQILRRQKQFHIATASDGSVEAEVSLAENESPEAKPVGTILVTSAPNTIVPETWHHVGFIYDRVTLTLHVDGIPVAMKLSKSGDPVVRDKSALEMGDRKGAFLGRLDGVKLSAVVPGEGIALPKDVKFGFPNVKLAVHFLSDGRLDPNWHRSPVAVPLEFPENVKKQVVVGVYGTAR
jgi:hypothetical protein